MAYFPEERVTITHGVSVLRGDSRPVASEYFEVIGVVGSGGMGDVHAATDLDLGRVVALKVIGGHLANDRALTAQFLTEAQVTAQLDHPHHVPVYRLEKTEYGLPAFSMKLIRGKTLCEVLEEGAMPLAERLEAFVAYPVPAVFGQRHREVWCCGSAGRPAPCDLALQRGVDRDPACAAAAPESLAVQRRTQLQRSGRRASVVTKRQTACRPVC